MEWGYGQSECGPEKWVNQFPIAAGNSQSPIDVNTGKWIIYRTYNINITSKT